MITPIPMVAPMAVATSNYALLLNAIALQSIHKVNKMLEDNNVGAYQRGKIKLKWFEYRLEKIDNHAWNNGHTTVQEKKILKKGWKDKVIKEREEYYKTQEYREYYGQTISLYITLSASILIGCVCIAYLVWTLVDHIKEKKNKNKEVKK